MGQGARVDFVFENQKTLLAHAVTRVHFPHFQWLVSLGAVRNANIRESPLLIIEAISKGKLVILRYLVDELGEPLDVKSIDGEYLLKIAKGQNNGKVLRYFLKAMQNSGIHIDAKELKKAQNIIKYS